MKRLFIIFSMLLLFSVCLVAQTIVLKAQYDSTPVMGGEYTVGNNVWGSTTNIQHLSVDTSGTYFSVIQSDANIAPGGNPVSYPFIYKGRHFGTSTTKNNPLSMMINQIKTAPFTWSITTATVSGTWDCAFESWFDVDGTSLKQNGELMIWINYQGSIKPGGSKIGTVNIGGYAWYLYYAPAVSTGWPTWNYIVYQLISPADSVSLDVKDFIRDAASRGYLYTTWYLNNMEAGFEIWTDGTGLTTNSFSASAVGGAPDTNYAPVRFSLTSPANNRKLTSMSIPFRWQPSIDPDDTVKTNVEYILHISGPNCDTTIAQIYTPAFTFIGTNHLQSLATYTWFVQATDGIDTTASTEKYTFTTPNITGVENGDQLPVEFSLGQNYPNPCNPSTRIPFSLPQRSTVTLEVHDLIGRRIAVLAQNETKNAGNYEVEFDGSYLSGGVYFYTLSIAPAVRHNPDPTTNRNGQSPVLTATRKLILVK